MPISHPRSTTFEKHSSMSAPKKTSTGLERQHAYRSFKERVDSLRIEPARNLSARAHDFVETSHFLVTLEHWKEVNVSANYTDFLDEVEPLCQTLPQILHHQKKIYDALERHVRVLDINSLQPLLELTAQFIHDLGPDFMTFYNLFLAMVIDISQKTNPNDSQNIRNTSNVLEWTFNALAYAFKYLARTLVLDLAPTFEMLLPVFEMTKKTYVARFCAEALSYLVKKLAPQTLLALVDLSFNKHAARLEENPSYREAMVVLYSESMKNTQNTFHSKSSNIFGVLLQNALAADHDNDSCIDALCDILLSIVEHGSPESCSKFYKAALEHLIEVVSKSDSAKRLGYVTHVLAVLCFAESGTKIQDWSVVFNVVLAITSNYDSLADTSSSNAVLGAFSYLFATIVRNCEMHLLTQQYNTMAEYLVSKQEGVYFLSFYELLMTNAKDKAQGFGTTQTVQKVINNATSMKALARISLCLSKIERLHSQVKNELTLPQFLADKILLEISKESKSLQFEVTRGLDDAQLLPIYWKLHLLTYCPELSDSKKILKKLLVTLSNHVPEHSCFYHDVLGLTFASTVRTLPSPGSEKHTVELYNVVKRSILPARKSTAFLNGFIALVDVAPLGLKETFSADKLELLEALTDSLSAPDGRIRRPAAECIRKLFVLIGEPVPYVVNQVGLIDNIPLTVERSNDVKMRIRLMFTEYAAQGNLTAADHTQLARYVVGLLTNSFQPCWQAVNENINKLHGEVCLDQVWLAFERILRIDFSTEKHSYWDDSAIFSTTENVLVGEFQSSNDRLSKYLDLVSSVITPAEGDIMDELYSRAKHGSPIVEYNMMLRNRVLLALASVPSAAERNGQALIEQYLDVYLESPDWNTKDKNALVTVFTKFRKIRKINNSALLYDAMTKQVLSKDTATQKLALAVLFTWNKPEINKYRDNLTNLLEDKLFRDELQLLVSKGSESKIEDGDREIVVPIVLRLLYGRAKGATNNKSKSGRKFAIASVLPNLPDEYITMFLLLTAEHLKIKDGYDTGNCLKPTQKEMRGMVGYLNMLYEVYVGLGYKFSHVLITSIRPLVFTLISAQAALDSADSDQRDCEDGNNELYVKIAKSVRQLGFKCLNHLFKVTCKTYDWKQEAAVIYEQIVKPRLARFPEENAQQPSSMMQMMLSWISSPELVSLYYFDNYASVHALVGLLANKFAKDTVRLAILDFCIASFTQKDIHDDQFYSVLAILVEGLLALLPGIIQSSEDKDINLRAATLLLLIIEGKYLDDDANTKGKLIDACSYALDKPASQIGLGDKISILLSLATVVAEYECDLDDVKPLYETCSRALRIYKDRNMRQALVKVFEVLGEKFAEVQVVSGLLASLNSYSERRIMEPDYERRMQAYRTLNEQLYTELSVFQWMPLVYANLFFINDPEELSLRSNGAHTITRFIDGMNARMDTEVDEYVAFWHTVIVPYLRAGLKKESEEIRDGYINVLAHAVRHHQHLPEMQTMAVLLSEDPDHDFFMNFNHVQLAHRQRALKTLEEHRNDISAECLYHYLLPMTEVYTVCLSDRLLPLWNDVNDKWQTLTLCLTWPHFRQLFRKHIAAASRATETELRDRCRLVVSISRGLKLSFDLIREGSDKDHFQNMPPSLETVHTQIMDDFLAPIMKMVKIRDDETIVYRVPMIEAAVNCLLCVSDSVAEASIAGVLTSTCQALRSRTQHVRDAIRKSLCRTARVLGSKYFRYIVKELKTALSRGAQIHTLSYTLHAILVAVKDIFSTGDLDESAGLIVDVIMEDIFGSAGQEKDAEGYVSKMIEVKAKMSYDSAEILTSNISFDRFRAIVDPLKWLMRENLPLKTKKNLDELIRRYAVGLNFNANAAKMDVLVLCYELHKQSTAVDEELPKRKNKRSQNSAEDHFLVDLNAKPVRMATDNTQIMCTLQTLLYELMRTALGLHKELLTVGNLEGFFPLMEQSLTLDNESLLCALYRVINLIITLPFSESRDDFFEKAALRAFKIIQDLPSTASLVSQIMLRFLASIIRHKPAIELNHASLTYLLVRIMPDLEEPHRQSLAFNFLKAVVRQHIMLPEVYDVMDKVRTIMVLNHTAEIRSMSRSVYFQFLMEYEQGTQKLDKAFKFLVNNLQYPTEDGRLSVMEFMHSIVLKASPSLLDQLSVSFFVGLANVLVADDVRKCREMAAELIGHILRKSAKRKTLVSMEDFLLAWVSNSSNPLLQRCGLMVYKVYVVEFSYGKSPKLDKCVMETVAQCFSRAKNDGSDLSASWEEVYTAMNVWAVLCKDQQDEILGKKYEYVWADICDTLLYPHTWVRLLGARLVGTLLTNSADVKFEVSAQQVQTIAYRLLRQLAAPTVSADLGTQVVKNMIHIITKWEEDNTPYIVVSDPELATSDEAPKYQLATDFSVDRICKIMRQERKGGTKQATAAVTAAIQMAAMISQILTPERLIEVAPKIILGLYMIVENKAYTDEEQELLNLGNECLKILENKMGATAYNEAYTQVKIQVNQRREQRKADKAQLALNAPEAAAKRKMKKHERFREKRKHSNRDENGFYRAKRRQPLR